MAHAPGNPDVQEWSEQDIAAMDLGYPEYTTRPCYNVEHHEEKDYIRSLLVWRENTEYYPETSKEHEVCYIIPAQVMVQVIVQNKYDVIVPNKNKPSERILCPKTLQDMYEAEDAVRRYARNAANCMLYAKLPYYPMQHNLPVVRMLQTRYNFKKWKPAPPTQQDWRAFIYAPTNIRYMKVTYAANCRHKTGAWDEHPWCAACILEAGIKPCAHPDEETDDPCYICATMSREAIIAYLKRIEEWSKPDEKGKKKTPKSRRLPTRIGCQVHADLANAPGAETDVNPAWAKGKLGICRPATVIPMYGVMEEMMRWTANQRLGAAKRHMRLFKQRYTEDREHYADELAWPDLKIYEKNDSDDEGDGDDELNPPESEKDDDSMDVDEEDNHRKEQSSKPQTPRRRKKSPRKRDSKRKETKIQKYQRMLREKDQELSALRSELKKSKKEVTELRNRTKPKDVKWRGNSAPCTIPTSNIYRTYDYHRALQAAARMSDDVKFIEPEVEPASKKRKTMHRSLLATKKKHFVADEDILSKVDKVLDEYAEDPWNPEFETSVDLCLADFAPSNILSEPPSTEPDMHGNRPGDADEVPVTQKEIVRLDAVNRAMVKIHETEEAFISALLDKMDISQITVEKEPDDAIVLEAMRQNHLSKETLLAEATAIVIATRRRDNVMRQNVPDHHRAAIIAHSVLPKEKSLIMRDRETQQGQGPSTNRNLTQCS